MDVKIIAKIAFIALEGHMFGNWFSLGTACAPVYRTISLTTYTEALYAKFH